MQQEPLSSAPRAYLFCADLVPVYHLGQTQLLTFWGTEEVSRRWRASVGLFWGAYGLPLPRKHQIITLVGAPIPGKCSLECLIVHTHKDCLP